MGYTGYYPADQIELILDIFSIIRLIRPFDSVFLSISQYISVIGILDLDLDLDLDLEPGSGTWIWTLDLALRPASENLISQITRF